MGGQGVGRCGEAGVAGGHGFRVCRRTGCGAKAQWLADICSECRAGAVFMAGGWPVFAQFAQHFVETPALTPALSRKREREHPIGQRKTVVLPTTPAFGRFAPLSRLRERGRG
ncbi:hypothetical protein CF68_22115 [Cupriavidus sp. SK-4]|nr:hypothetical protein CF68_22115 [Cupriavidus sp. SK-4]